MDSTVSSSQGSIPSSSTTATTTTTISSSSTVAVNTVPTNIACLTNSTNNSHAATRSTTHRRTYVRHHWTAAEVDYLCCLRIHGKLSYNDISLKIHQHLHSARLDPDMIRYKINVLSNRLAPTQSARRSKAVYTNPRWVHFSNTSPKDLEVQRILRTCRCSPMWEDQVEEDYLCVLMMYGGLLDGEVARRLNARFDGSSWSAEGVKDWFDDLEQNKEGSWLWFSERDEQDPEVKGILGQFGLDGI